MGTIVKWVGAFFVISFLMGACQVVSGMLASPGIQIGQTLIHWSWILGAVLFWWVWGLKVGD